MSNRDRAAEIIYRTLNPKYGDFSHHEETADALVAAGVLAPGDQFRAARGVLTEWWLNLDQTSDPRASAVRAVIDMMDDQMKAAAHVDETLGDTDE